jgi:hypothetical protein
MTPVRIQLIKRGTKTSKAKKGDVGTIVDYNARGDVFIRWDDRPHELEKMASWVDQWIGLPPPSDD